jgi:hypothetical protein
MAVPNSTFSDDFVATAIARWASDALYDQIFDKTYLLNWLKRNQRPLPDGLKINEPLQYATSTTAGSFTKGSTFALQDRAIATVAQYDWTTYGDGIAVYPQDIMKCSGESQKVNLLNAKMENLQRGLLDAINTDLWATTWTDSTKIISLPVMVDATTDIGSVDVSENSWWGSRLEATSEAISTSRMANTYNYCSLGQAGEAPDLILTTQTLYESYGEIVLPYYRFGSAREGDLGFTSLRFMNADVAFDENCPSGYVMMLNSKYLKWTPHSDNASKFMVWEGKPNDQIANTRILWGMFALTCSRRSSLGKQTSKSAP